MIVWIKIFAPGNFDEVGMYLDNDETFLSAFQQLKSLLLFLSLLLVLLLQF